MQRKDSKVHHIREWFIINNILNWKIMKMKSLLVALATVLMGMGTGCQKEDTQVGTS
jgi:hypothetical protein